MGWKRKIARNRIIIDLIELAKVSKPLQGELKGLVIIILQERIGGAFDK
jgi:hypothetical protein